MYNARRKSIFVVVVVFELEISYPQGNDKTVIWVKLLIFVSVKG